MSGNNVTGGKRRSGRTNKGDRWLREILVECAWAAARSRDSYLSAQFWHLARRIGKKKAAVAVAHSILVIAWHLLSRHDVHRPAAPVVHADVGLLAVALRPNATIDVRLDEFQHLLERRPDSQLGALWRRHRLEQLSSQNEHPAKERIVAPELLEGYNLLGFTSTTGRTRTSVGVSRGVMTTSSSTRRVSAHGVGGASGSPNRMSCSGMGVIPSTTVIVVATHR